MSVATRGVALCQISEPLELALLPLCRMQALLKGSKFRPSNLTKDQQKRFVELLKKMEGGYPRDAAPLVDPALSGEWNVVYSDSRKVSSGARAVRKFIFPGSAAQTDVLKHLFCNGRPRAKQVVHAALCYLRTMSTM